jgi:ABC-type glycerol-3-phosphate transport system substrate-binding protein
MKTSINKYIIHFLFSAFLLICTTLTASASQPKPPHGHWIGKITSLTDSSVTLTVIESWEYGSVGKKGSGKEESFKAEKGGVTINGKSAANEKISEHFKVGDVVTLGWIEEENRDKRLFSDITKGR